MHGFGKHDKHWAGTGVLGVISSAEHGSVALWQTRVAPLMMYEYES